MSGHGTLRTERWGPGKRSTHHVVSDYRTHSSIWPLFLIEGVFQGSPIFVFRSLHVTSVTQFMNLYLTLTLGLCIIVYNILCRNHETKGLQSTVSSFHLWRSSSPVKNYPRLLKMEVGRSNLEKSSTSNPGW